MLINNPSAFLTLYCCEHSFTIHCADWPSLKPQILFTNIPKQSCRTWRPTETTAGRREETKAGEEEKCVGSCMRAAAVYSCSLAATWPTAPCTPLQLARLTPAAGHGVQDCLHQLHPAPPPSSNSESSRLHSTAVSALLCVGGSPAPDAFSHRQNAKLPRKRNNLFVLKI